MEQHAVVTLPLDPPRPVDDGAADHLEGMVIPSISLASTFGGLVDLSRLSSPRSIAIL
jgi:hypothetical protein